MSILEILASGGGVILLLMTMVQIAPVKINPWRWVGRMIGSVRTAYWNREEAGRAYRHG